MHAPLYLQHSTIIIFILRTILLGSSPPLREAHSIISFPPSRSLSTKSLLPRVPLENKVTPDKKPLAKDTEEPLAHFKRNT